MRLQIFVVSALIPVSASVTQLAVAQPAPPPTYSADLTRAAVRRVTTAAADWQLAHPSEHPPYDWTVAAFYTGMMAFSKQSDSSKYYDAMKAMGERNQWRPGLRPGVADHHAHSRVSIAFPHVSGSLNGSAARKSNSASAGSSIFLSFSRWKIFA